MIPSTPNHNSPLHISSTLGSVCYEFIYVTQIQKIKFFCWYVLSFQINEKLLEGKGSIKYFYYQIVAYFCVCMCVCVCVETQLIQLCLTLVSPWTTVCQATLSMGISRQEYWSELPGLPPGDLPNPGIELASPALRADSLPLSHWGNPLCVYTS